jgi:hypothetical protein
VVGMLTDAPGGGCEKTLPVPEWNLPRENLASSPVAAILACSCGAAAGKREKLPRRVGRIEADFRLPKTMCPEQLSQLYALTRGIAMVIAESLSQLK